MTRTSPDRAAAPPQQGRQLATTMGQAVAVATATVVPVFLTGGLAVALSEDLGFPVTSLGLAPAAFFGAAAVCSPIAGYVTERIGPGLAMRIAVWAVATVLVVAAVVVHSLPVLLVLLAVAGAGNALAQPATNLFLAQRVPWQRQGTAYGVKQSAIPTAGLLAGLAVPLLGVTVGWRWAFAAMALPAVLVAGRIPAAGPRPRVTGADRRRSGDVGRPTLVVMAFPAGLAAASGSALGIFMVAGAVEAGWNEATAGLLFAGASAVGIATRLWSGFRADRRGRNHLGVIILMLVLGSVGFFLLAPSNQLLFALGAPIAFGAGWGWPGLFILAVVQASPSSPAAATGLTQAGTSVGAVVGPVAFGVVADHVSFAAAWTLAGGGALLSAAIFILIRQFTRVAQHRPAATRHGGQPMHERELIESYFAACSRGNAEAIASHFHDAAVVYDTNHTPVRGAEQIGRFYAGMARRWGGAVWHVDTFVTDPSGAAASEWTMEVTNDAVLIRGSEHYEIQSGRISQIRQYWTFNPDGPATALQDFPYPEDTRFWKLTRKDTA